ncbi:thioesterase family protein [Nocardia sp. R7R-8]|uniref:thioesterase family protein n=1 Tax=Nocardia sp. R7R-8 TaxID=3459304 RepID=UPI00403E0B91
MTGNSLPGVTVERIVEWPDTDAAGHYHHSTVVRWVEAAEAELHEQLGLSNLFGVIPRVRYEVDYRARLWFRDRVTITLRLAAVGRTSIRYSFTVRRGDEVAASGAMSAVHIDAGEGRAVPWPDEVRALLGVAGSAHPREGAPGPSPQDQYMPHI